NDELIQKAYDNGEILRTHVMRPTWHFVAPHDLRWILELTEPRVSQAMSHYNKLLNLDRKVFDKANAIIGKVLKNQNYLTRQELKKFLDKKGITTNVQRLAHIVMNAE